MTYLSPYTSCRTTFCLNSDIVCIPLRNNCLHLDVSGLLTLPLRPVLGGGRTGSSNSPAGKGLKEMSSGHACFSQVVICVSSPAYKYIYNQYSEYMYTYNQYSDIHVHLQPALRHTCTPTTSTPNTCTPTTSTPTYMYTYLQPVLRQTCTSTTCTPDIHVHLQPVLRHICTPRTSTSKFHFPLK